MTPSPKCLRAVAWIFVPLFGLVLFLSNVASEPPRQLREDPLAVDAQWKGKLTQIAKTSDDAYFPPELNAALTITGRNGDSFEGELHESSDHLDITFLVRGQVVQAADNGLTIEFKSHDVKGIPNAAVYYVNVVYSARLNGAGLKGTWAYEDKDSGTTLRGEFTLKPAAE